ncbi:galactosylceramidase [Acidobacteria bacterium AB60]|nr:galactosylceramidase [Acidobacteria bacterium AB60]
MSLAQSAEGLRNVQLQGSDAGKRFDGIGFVNGGGATSVLLKDYPEPQRSQILDLLFKPNTGAAASALLVEIPGDGNSTQGSMPSHMHTREDLNYSRGYTWWILREAKKRNPNLTLTGMAWSAPGWVGNGNFWSQDAADYYVKWLTGLRKVYGLEFDAIGLRNERGVSFEFAKILRTTLDSNGFRKITIQGFDNWPEDKFDFVKTMISDPDKRNAVNIISAHTLVNTPAAAGDKVKQWADQLNKPVWNSEEHVYKKGFDCEISIVQAFNLNFIRYGATLVVNWYDVAGLYPLEPYSEDPAAVLARSPWSGNYQVREALWGYAHYGQFTAPGWRYLEHDYGELANGGSFVTLKSPGEDYSIIIETKDAKGPQQIRFEIGQGLSKKSLSVWRSNEVAQFVRQDSIAPAHGAFALTLQPNSIYTLTTTAGQQKGSFANIPAPKPFPFPYYETFDEYSSPADYGYLPRYTADIDDAFEIVERPDKKGQALRQVVPVPPNSWAPEWRPYTILGDDQWTDYEVSADVYLNPGDSAGVMGRVNDVGSGYGTIPKGYFLEVDGSGLCRLVVVRGKADKSTPVGDAEQQALIRAGKEMSVGGEQILSKTQVPSLRPGEWHHLKLRLQGNSISGEVDGKAAGSATDSTYLRGVAGLVAGRSPQRLSMPYYDNLLINRLGAPRPTPFSPAPGQWPIYGGVAHN